MQSLYGATNLRGADGCAKALLDVVPTVIWFIRREMRSFRRGLSLPQFRALVFVQSKPRASLSSVADHIGQSLPTASRVVGGLVRRGLLARVGCPKDRRQLAISLTPRGEEVLKTAWQGTERKIAAELQPMSAEQRQAVCDAMEALRGIFGSVYHGRGDLNEPEEEAAATNG